MTLFRKFIFVMKVSDEETTEKSTHLWTKSNLKCVEWGEEKWINATVIMKRKLTFNRLTKCGGDCASNNLRSSSSKTFRQKSRKTKKTRSLNFLLLTLSMQKTSTVCVQLKTFWCDKMERKKTAKLNFYDLKRGKKLKTHKRDCFLLIRILSRFFFQLWLWLGGRGDFSVTSRRLKERWLFTWR